MKCVVEDRVSIELLPGIPLRPQIQPGVVLPDAVVGLSEAGSCLIISVSSSTVKFLGLGLGLEMGIFLPTPCLSIDTLVCFIILLAAVVYNIVVTNIVIGLGEIFLQD